jgi:hypothetical protein
LILASEFGWVIAKPEILSVGTFGREIVSGGGLGLEGSCSLLKNSENSQWLNELGYSKA